jgi:hypothetical protein
MDEHIHNPTPVLAIQVARPWKSIQFRVPFAHMVKRASGAFDYFRVANVGELEVYRAYEGDWILKNPRTGKYSVMPDDEFQYYFGKKDEDGDGNAADD